VCYWELIFVLGRLFLERSNSGFEIETQIEKGLSMGKNVFDYFWS
jgi:hypothetical protein